MSWRKKSALLVELSVPMRMTVPVQEEQNAIRNLPKLSEDEAFIADVEDNYGHRGAKQAKELLAEVTGLFAGGEMADEDMREMVDAIQEAYLIAKKNNKKYTPKKYRKDE